MIFLIRTDLFSTPHPRRQLPIWLGFSSAVLPLGQLIDWQGKRPLNSSLRFVSFCNFSNFITISLVSWFFTTDLIKFAVSSSKQWEKHHQIPSKFVTFQISSLMFPLPSGELTFCHGKSPFFMGKSTISMAIFNRYVSHYQRVSPIKSH